MFLPIKALRQNVRSDLVTRSLATGRRTGGSVPPGSVGRPLPPMPARHPQTVDAGPNRLRRPPGPPAVRLHPSGPDTRRSAAAGRCPCGLIRPGPSIRQQCLLDTNCLLQCLFILFTVFFELCCLGLILKRPASLVNSSIPKCDLPKYSPSPARFFPAHTCHK
jgi:hypothetical protein